MFTFIACKASLSTSHMAVSKSSLSHHHQWLVTVSWKHREKRSWVLGYKGQYSKAWQLSYFPVEMAQSLYFPFYSLSSRPSPPSTHISPIYSEGLQASAKDIEMSRGQQSRAGRHLNQNQTNRAQNIFRNCWHSVETHGLLKDKDSWKLLTPPKVGPRLVNANTFSLHSACCRPIAHTHMHSAQPHSCPNPRRTAAPRPTPKLSSKMSNVFHCEQEMG